MSRQTAKFSAAIKRAKRLYKTGRYKTFGDAVKAAYKKGKTKTVGSHKKKKAIPTKIKTKGKTHYNWLNPKVTRQPIRPKTKGSRGVGSVGSPFKNMSEVKAKNKESGFYFFSPGTMKFFKSRVVSPLLMGRYFITSETFVSSDGKFSEKTFAIRWAENNGNIKTLEVGGKTKFKTKDAARQAITDHWFKT